VGTDSDNPKWEVAGVPAEQIDFVVGVDTHKATHTATVVTPTGGVLAQLTVSAEAAGSRQVLQFARRAAAGDGSG
jgi:hypothetical protein